MNNETLCIESAGPESQPATTDAATTDAATTDAATTDAATTDAATTDAATTDAAQATVTVTLKNRDTKTRDLANKDLSKHAAGAFDLALFDGAPVDAVKRFILARAGVGAADAEVQGLRDVRLDFQPAKDEKGNLLEPDVPRVPKGFPPADYAQPLSSIADWLACVDACKKAA